LPVSYIIPPLVRVFGIRISWVDCICWLALIFLRNKWKARRLIFWICLLGLITTVSNMYGMVTLGYGFNPKNFAIIKYIFTYLGAIAIGINLPIDKIFDNKASLPCLFILFIMALGAAVSPDIGIFLAKVYGQENYMDVSYRLIFMDPNPNMVGQVAVVLAMMSIVSYQRLAILPLVTAGIVVILCASRANIVILTIFILFYFSQHGNLKRLLLILLGIVIIFTLCEVNRPLLNPLFQRRVPRIESFRTGIVGRLYTYKQSLADFRDSPLMGKGYRKRYMIGSKYFDYAGSTTAIEAHSEWVAFLCNHGIIGFLSLCGFSYEIGRRLLEICRKSGSEKDSIKSEQVRKFLLAVYLCYLVSMIPWETLYLPIYSSFFFVCFGKIYHIKE